MFIATAPAPRSPINPGFSFVMTTPLLTKRMVVG